MAFLKVRFQDKKLSTNSSIKMLHYSHLCNKIKIGCHCRKLLWNFSVVELLQSLSSGMIRVGTCQKAICYTLMKTLNKASKCEDRFILVHTKIDTRCVSSRFYPQYLSFLLDQRGSYQHQILVLKSRKCALEGTFLHAKIVKQF